MSRQSGWNGSFGSTRAGLVAGWTVSNGGKAAVRFIADAMLGALKALIAKKRDLKQVA
jgi:hypothetical protein